MLPLLRATSAITVATQSNGVTAYVTVPETPAKGTASPSRLWTGQMADGRWVGIVPLDSGGPAGIDYALMWVWTNGQAQFVGEIPAENQGFGHLSMSVEDGLINLSWPVYAPNDGSCCPSRVRVKVLTLDGTRLRPLSDQTTGSPSAGTDTLGSWPVGRTGYTVILSSARSRAAAEARARAFRDGGTFVGTLHSDDFSSLRSGYWVVFSGQYTDLKAAQDAARAARSLVPDAYAKQIIPR